MVSLYESLLETNSYSEELTYELRGTVAIDGYPLLHVDSLIAPTEQLPSALRAALTVGQRFQAVYGNSARVRNIQRIDLDIDSLPGRRSIQLERAQATQPAAHPGDTVMVEATLRPFRGETKNLRIPIPLPLTLNPGPSADPAQRWSHPRPVDHSILCERGPAGIEQHYSPDERGCTRTTACT